MSESNQDLTDEGLGRRLGTDLPRYAAPARLRAALVDAARPRARAPWWLAPSLAAAATALVAVLVTLPVLPRVTPADPLQRYVRSVVSEHARTVMWGARAEEVIPAALPWLAQESGIALSQVFAGDDRLDVVGAEPVYLERQRGVAIHYRDTDGRMLTYVALPAPGLAVAERQRVTIGRWRPALVRDSGFAAWVWKQGEVGCFLVSDMAAEGDLERFKDYFARVRSATDPVLVR
jgi:hypothetical protein